MTRKSVRSSTKTTLTVLGRTAVMVNQSLNRGNKLFYLSYWRSMEDLHAFNQSKYHAEGLKWWAENHKRCPHIGIFHETFEAPPHHWETIYENMHPFGMGEYGERALVNVALC